ncbi:MAG: hypothetical protein MZU91_13385 [Desulfosudis oleivorans]|nr:hypothetical protein [Desulfosudis oleivorans]
MVPGFPGCEPGPLAAVRPSPCPLVIVHGDRDETVPVGHARKALCCGMAAQEADHPGRRRSPAEKGPTDHAGDPGPG